MSKQPQNPFKRSLAIFAAMQAMMAEGLSAATAAIQAGAGQYKSRGKGRGAPSPRFGRTGKNYPFSNTKQNERYARQLTTRTVNGFELIQQKGN